MYKIAICSLFIKLVSFKKTFFYNIAICSLFIKVLSFPHKN